MAGAHQHHQLPTILFENQKRFPVRVVASGLFEIGQDRESFSLLHFDTVVGSSRSRRWRQDQIRAVRTHDLTGDVVGMKPMPDGAEKIAGLDLASGAFVLTGSGCHRIFSPLTNVDPAPCEAGVHVYSGAVVMNVGLNKLRTTRHLNLPNRGSGDDLFQPWKSLKRAASSSRSKRNVKSVS